jgi:hypothetical protein
MHKIEVAELAKQNLHVFRVTIEGHGQEEVAFQGTTREDALRKLREWIASEPFVNFDAAE